jgi:N-acetylglutamate synthase-like GNAT family acetyltransferase
VQKAAQAASQVLTMTVEVLPKERWSELSCVPQSGTGALPEKSSVAVVARDGAGEICGTLVLVCPWHLEGAWVRPDKRGSPVLGALVRKAEAIAVRAGLTRLFAYGASPEMEDYIERLGYERMPLSVWAKTVGSHQSAVASEHLSSPQ